MARQHSVLLPLLVCILLFLFASHYGYTVIYGRSTNPVEALLAGATIGLSAFCIILLVQLRRQYRRAAASPDKLRVKELQAHLEGLRAKNQDDTTKLKNLSHQVEILSAMREISLMASQDVDFERLVEHALELVEHLIGTREITLFLRPEDDQKVLKVRARRAGGETLFNSAIPPEAVDLTNVAEVARYGNIKRLETEKMLDLTVPVMVDREILGVVKVKIDKEQYSPDELDRAHLNLRNILNHIGLAIKTPTLYDRAVLDSLTGLYTKRHLTAELNKIFPGCKRLSKSLAVIMIDLDHFKKINDKYGHLTGDIVLRDVASIVKREIRDYDSAFRYGGEEICVLLPDTDSRSALSVAERIRKKIGKNRFRGDTNQKVSMTVSAGVAVFHKNMDKSEDLISDADSALYKAKRGGRNQVKFYRRKTTMP